jgi:hypothetical protein
MSGDYGVQSAEIAKGVFGFELKVGGEDLAGGVLLKAEESERRAAAFEPIMTAGVGEHHRAEAADGASGGRGSGGDGASAEKPA